MMLSKLLTFYLTSPLHDSGCCALTYLVCGILCFDRFTALAFLSTKDPRVTTAIPSPTMEGDGATEGMTAMPQDQGMSNDSEGLYA